MNNGALNPLTVEILEYCGTKRRMSEIRQRFPQGRAVRFTVHNLRKKGKLVNLQPTEREGVYVRAAGSDPSFQPLLSAWR